MNAVNGFLEGFFLATFKINNLVFYGNDVGVVNDKEVLEADACVGLTRIDVLLPLLQKMISTGPVTNWMVFVVGILYPELIGTDVVSGVILLEDLGCVVAVSIDVDGRNCFGKENVMFLVKNVVQNWVEDGEILLRVDGLFAAEVDTGTCVTGADMLLSLLKNVVFNDSDCVSDVIWYVSVVW